MAIIRIKWSIDYLTVDSIFENFPKKTTLIGNFYYKFIFYKLFLVDFCRVSTIDYQGMTKLKSVAKDYSQFLLVEVDEKLHDSMKNSELFEISTVSGFVLILFLHLLLRSKYLKTNSLNRKKFFSKANFQFSAHCRYMSLFGYLVAIWVPGGFQKSKVSILVSKIIFY